MARMAHWLTDLADPNLLEVEPAGGILNTQEDGFEDSQKDSHREQRAVLVASGRAKEIIGIELTQDQVKSASAKDVEKYFKRYEASLSSKTHDTMVDTFLKLSCKTLSHFLPLDSERLFVDLNQNFMVKKELSMIPARLSLKYGKYMAGFSAALLTVKNLKPEELATAAAGASAKLETNFERQGEQLVKELE